MGTFQVFTRGASALSLLRRLDRSKRCTTKVKYIGPAGWASFQNRSSRAAGKRYFEFGISKQQSHFVNRLSRIYTLIFRSALSK